MKRRKMFLNLLIITILLFAPLGVNAANYDSCIEKFGSITLESTGGDNSNLTPTNIDYQNPKNNDDWNTNPVTFSVNVQAQLNYNVKKIYYKIYSFGNDTCSGYITGSDIENNKGNVKLNVVIDKGYVEKIAFGGTQVNKKDPNKIGKIKVENMNIHKEENDESSENENYAGVTCNDKNGDGEIDPSECTYEKIEICDDNIKELINKYWKWIVFLVPFALLIFISIDFMKAMTSGEADSIKKSGNNALKRVIAALILLLLPTILRIVFTWFGIENYLCF